MPRIDHTPIFIRTDCATLLRHIERVEVPDTIESMVFLDYPDMINILVLLSPVAKHTEYLKKLFWVAEKLI
jgi:hypothetical protein